MKLWVPDDAAARRLGDAARRMGVELRQLPSLADFRSMFRIPIIADPSMPPNSFELRSGEQRVRVRWPDEATELDRWADDGGAP